MFTCVVLCNIKKGEIVRKKYNTLNILIMFLKTTSLVLEIHVANVFDICCLETKCICFV